MLIAYVLMLFWKTMPNRYGSKINLLDDENCEGTKTKSNSAAESKHISICVSGQ